MAGSRGDLSSGCSSPSRRASPCRMLTSLTHERRPLVGHRGGVPLGTRPARTGGQPRLAIHCRRGGPPDGEPARARPSAPRTHYSLERRSGPPSANRQRSRFVSLDGRLARPPSEGGFPGRASRPDHIDIAVLAPLGPTERISFRRVCGGSDSEHESRVFAWAPLLGRSEMNACRTTPSAWEPSWTRPVHRTFVLVPLLRAQ